VLKIPPIPHVGRLVQDMATSEPLPKIYLFRSPVRTYECSVPSPLATNLHSHCLNSGTRVSVVFYPWSDSGSAVMSLDGAIIDTVNTVGTTVTCGERTWTSNIFPSAAHVFTITSNGTLAIYRIMCVCYPMQPDH
jgi:hypothetical protein